MSTIKSIPEGYHNVTPYLFVRSAASAIDFYRNVFSATEVVRMVGSNGKIMHAELRIGDSCGGRFARGNAQAHDGSDEPDGRLVATHGSAVRRTGSRGTVRLGGCPYCHGNKPHHH